MKYDFDKIIDRSNTEAVKYQMRKPNFKTEDVIPLWVADMDFEGPRCCASPDPPHRNV